MRCTQIFVIGTNPGQYPLDTFIQDSYLSTPISYIMYNGAPQIPTFFSQDCSVSRINFGFTLRQDDIIICCR